MSRFSTISNRVRSAFHVLLNRGADEPSPGYASRLVRANNVWRETYNPLRGLDIERAVQLIEQLQAGEYCDPQWAFYHMERQYPTLAALIERRTSAIVELDWSIRTIDQDRWPKGGSQQMAADQAGFLKELYQGIDNLTDAMECLAMASFRGYCLLEKVDLNGDGLVDHLNTTDTWNWLRKGMNGGWIWNPECRLSARSAAASNFVEEEYFLIRTVPRPLDLIALPLFCKSALGEKDWAAFIEIFGIPGGVVIGPPGVPPAREKLYETAGQRIAEGGVGYMPNGSEYVPNNPPHQGAPFSEFLRYQKEELVLAGTGGQLTMLAESGSGTLAGGAHQETFTKIARAEGLKISGGVFQRQLDKPELAKRFPGMPILAYFELDVRQSPTTKEVINDVKELSTAGFQVDPEEISERTGYSVTTKAPADPFGFARDPSVPKDPEVDPSKDPEDLEDPKVDPIQNRSKEDPAVAAVARAVAADLAPIRDQLSAIADIENPEARQVALLTFMENAPQQAHAILSKPSAAEAIGDALATAYANGLVKAKTPK